MVLIWKHLDWLLEQIKLKEGSCKDSQYKLFYQQSLTYTYKEHQKAFHTFLAATTSGLSPRPIEKVCRGSLQPFCFNFFAVMAATREESSPPVTGTDSKGDVISAEAAQTTLRSSKTCLTASFPLFCWPSVSSPRRWSTTCECFL